MISVEEALERVTKALSPLGRETLALTNALNRVLAEDLAARTTQPPQAVSAMDGYAARAADIQSVPASLRLVAEIPAGSQFEGEIQPGEAARIFTGAPLPAGADCIVIQEDSERQGKTVTVKQSCTAGRYVRPAGLDFGRGDVLMAAGTRLTPAKIGLAAAMDRPWLSVYRKPRVAILSTGDEVVLPGEERGPAQIVSSNGFSLAAFVESHGGDPILLAIAKDDRDQLREAVTQIRGADLLVTSGGASVGEHDLLQSSFESQGFQRDFWKIAMRPGKPLIFGMLGDRPWLGLPGNPVSSLVCATLFLSAMLAKMQGLSPTLQYELGTLACDLPANDHRQDYLRASLEIDTEGKAHLDPFPRQDSSMLATLARATALVMRPPHAPEAKRGDSVKFLRLPA